MENRTLKKLHKININEKKYTYNGLDHNLLDLLPSFIKRHGEVFSESYKNYPVKN